MKPEATTAFTTAQHLHRSGRLPEAEALYREVLRGEPEHPEALLFLGLLRHQQGHGDEALALMRRAIAQAPWVPAYHCNLALVLTGLGKTPEAMAAYRQALVLQPDYAEAHLNLGILLKQQGAIEDAIGHYRRAIAARPELAPAYNSLGNVLRERGEYEAAVAAFTEALRIQPDAAVTHYNLAGALKNLNRLEEAVTHYRKTIEIKPDNAEAYYNLGLILHAEGKSEEAVEVLRNAIRLKPDFGDVYNSLAGLLATQGRGDQAIGYHRQAIRIEPRSAKFHFDYGVTLLGLKRFSEAIERLREVLNLEPWHEEARYVLAALGGAPMPSTAPPDYVAKLFDNFSDKFDFHLVQKLGYNIPEEISQAVRRLLGAGSKDLEVIDLGCGTGLCGLLLRDRARTLTGVDLSEKMLAKARERRVYDTLLRADVTEALRRSAVAYDLVVAADVFVYVGELKAVFAATAVALKPGGLFAFSVEAEAEGVPYALHPTGRYTHSLGYLRALAQRHGLTERLMEPKTIRKEKGIPVAGHLFVLGKPETSNETKTEQHS